ncbi:MAG: hypothetical protein KGL39_57650 [Patescibacteria group bacterium]|nr:hypothetical protein [Patescibacteria group bacterium]
MNRDGVSTADAKPILARIPKDRGARPAATFFRLLTKSDMQPPYLASERQLNVIGYFLFDIKAPMGTEKLSTLDRSTASDIVGDIYSKDIKRKEFAVKQLQHLGMVDKSFTY